MSHEKNIINILIFFSNVFGKKNRNEFIDFFININNFSIFYNKLESNIYGAMTSVFRALGNKNTIVNDYQLYAYWALQFYIRIESFIKETSFKLHANGNKSLFTIIPCSFYITPFKAEPNTNLFIKLVKYPEMNPAELPKNMDYDPIIIDCINGKIINYLVNKHNDLDYSFMTFVDSFLHFKDTSYDNWDFLNLNDITIEPMCNDNTNSQRQTRSKTLSKKTRFEKYYSIVSYAVSGNDIYTHFIKNTDYNDIYNAIPELYRKIIDLGTKYGFIHNDLHLGNLIFNKKTKKIVCIDYGRSHFQYFEDKPTEIIDKMAVFEYEKLGYTSEDYKKEKNLFLKPPSIKSYKELMKLKNNDWLRSNYKISKYNSYPLCIFDLIILSGNFYLFYLRNTQKYKSLIDKMIKFEYKTENDLLNRKIIIITPQTREEIYMAYFDILKSPIFDESLSFILDGLFFLALFIAFYYENENKVHVIDLYYDYNNNNGILYKMFHIILNKHEMYKFNDFCSKVIEGELLNDITKKDIVNMSEYLKKLKDTQNTTTSLSYIKMMGGTDYMMRKPNKTNDDDPHKILQDIKERVSTNLL
jgi:hypothetical protein